MDSETKSSENICSFIVPRKKRRCKMKIKEGSKYCPEHLLLEKQSENHVDPVAHENETNSETKTLRIPCPLDPKHSCYAHMLKKHLSKCNARQKSEPAYIVKRVNSSQITQAEVNLRLSDVEDETILSLISRIQEAHKSCVGELALNTESHSAFEESIAVVQPEAYAWKHLVQNASIVGHVLKHGLAAEPAKSVFVEFGSGRGQLACWLGAALNRPFEGTGQFLLIDRTSPRHKQDNKFKDDPQLNFERARADIADLFLPGHPSISQRPLAIGVGKHLCGAATDLSLRALSQLGEKFQGVAIALCCHHRCSFSEYVGVKYLEALGFDQRDFSLMKGISSWATCGLRRTKEEPLDAEPAVVDSNDAGEPADEHLVSTQIPEMQNRYEVMNLGHDTRERVGRQCKQLIDWGRKKFLEELGLVSELRYYVESKVSLENVILIATRSESVKGSQK